MDVTTVITVSDMDADYYTCNACGCRNDVKDITVGFGVQGGAITRSIRLCKSCRQVLKEQL